MGIKKQTNHQNKKTKNVVVIEDSMLNGISEKGLCKSHKVIVENFPGGTSNTIVENLDQLLKENPDDLIIHVEANDLKKYIKLLNNVKKIVKKVSREAPSTNLAFSSIIVRKDKQK